MYCGNNARHPDLQNGNQVLGTRYRCLRKGIGVGLNQPYDPNYGDYDPIDNTRIYCGNSEQLPQGYDRFGNLPQCLQVGVGVGKNMAFNNGPPQHGFGGAKVVKYIWPTILCILVSISIFLGLYFGKPSFVTKKVGNKKEIIWSRFFIFYTLMVVIIFLIWKLYILRL